MTSVETECCMHMMYRTAAGLPENAQVVGAKRMTLKEVRRYPCFVCVCPCAPVLREPNVSHFFCLRSDLNYVAQEVDSNPVQSLFAPVLYEPKPGFFLLSSLVLPGEVMNVLFDSDRSQPTNGLLFG